MRLFIAVELDEAVRQRLGKAQDRLRSAPCHVKWVKPELMHLTLRFLGEADEALVGILGQVMASAALGIAPVEVTVAGLGTFPERGAPRVVWAGLRDDGSLALLSRRLEEGVRRLGFAPEDRPFRPHLTLGRVNGRQGADELRRRLAAQATDTFGSCTIAELLLIQSVLSPAGPAYTPLRRHPL
ncbi:MAG TPA: RNA 2',3'-cyclic phosphodiesterase [Planctomycetota bacterium]|nr:RNA 2',3'-cyclic phosphodiesterase [Planctomycetota bacterium]